MGIVTDILASLDASVSDVGQRFFESTAAALGPVVTIMITLLIVLIGINMAIGAHNVSMRDAVQLIWRIVLVYVFALSWANFSALYFALSDASSNLAIGFFNVAQNEAPNANAAMDGFAVNMADTVDVVSKSRGSIQRGVIGGISYVVLAVLMAAYVLIVGFAKIMIAFLLGVAPLAMTCTIFDKTRNLFEAWLTAFVGYLLYPIAAAAVISSVVKVGESQFTNPENAVNLATILGFFVVVFVGIFALKSIPQAASHITGQFHLANIAPEAVRIANRPNSAIGGFLAPRVHAAGAGMMSGSMSPRLAAQARDRRWAERGGKLAEKMRLSKILR